MFKIKLAFLDRDGTLNVEKNYLHRIEDWEWIPGVPSALRQLQEAKFQIVVVTNQSGIARGYYGHDEVKKLHAFIRKDASKFGVFIHRFVYCPHHPCGLGKYKQTCCCRKPGTGLLENVVRDLNWNWDREASFMVGDNATDVECGLNFGISTYLVRTGYGRRSEPNVLVPTFDDLPTAVQAILSTPARTETRHLESSAP